MSKQELGKTMTTIDRLTFTKLFAQRSGASFATVLNECLKTKDFIHLFNAKHQTSLALDERAGRVVVLTPKADLKRETKLFAMFAWNEVFLQIQIRKQAA